MDNRKPVDITEEGYQLYELEEPLVDAVRLKLMQKGARPLLHGYGEDDLSVGEEDEGNASEACYQTTVQFYELRRTARWAIESIVGHVFDKFDLPRGNGLEIGSGPYGEMANNYMPSDIQRKTWEEVEINPHSIEHNMRLNPGSVIHQGSYLNLCGADGVGLEKGSRDIVTGLSSLDSTTFVDIALEQIRQVLRDGGYLLHVQDLGPSDGVIEHFVRTHFGMPSPHNCFFAGSGYPSAYVLPYGGVLTSGELFRLYLRFAVERTEGLELVFDKWITAVRMCDDGPPWPEVYSEGLWAMGPRSSDDRGCGASPQIVSASVMLARKVA